MQACQCAFILKSNINIFFIYLLNRRAFRHFMLPIQNRETFSSLRRSFFYWNTSYFYVRWPITFIEETQSRGSNVNKLNNNAIKIEVPQKAVCSESYTDCLSPPGAMWASCARTFYPEAHTVQIDAEAESWTTKLLQLHRYQVTCCPTAPVCCPPPTSTPRGRWNSFTYDICSTTVETADFKVENLTQTCRSVHFTASGVQMLAIEF